MKVLEKMGDFAIPTYLFGYCFIEVGETAGEHAFTAAVVILTVGLCLSVTLALWNYIVIPNRVILNIFMLSCLNVLDVTLKCLYSSPI